MKTIVSSVSLWQERVRAWYSIEGRRMVTDFGHKLGRANSINLKVLQMSQLTAARAEQPGTYIGNVAPALASLLLMCK